MENNNNLTPNCQDLKRLGTIYLIINLLNGKKYVGQTRQKLRKRINQHCYSKVKVGIDGAIKKYGWEKNFKVEILEECPVEMLNEREIFWIAELNTKVPNGYNLTDGGEGSLNPSAETRAKLSAAQKGRKVSEETKAKFSASQKGRTAPNKGKPHSAETKLKISIARCCW